MVIGQRGHDRRFRDEPGREGNGGERAASDQHGCGGHGHQLCEAAERRQSDLARGAQNGARRHHQQRLVEDVHEGVRGGGGQREFGTDPDGDQHEAHLPDDRIGQDAADVVLDQRIDERINRHEETDRDEHSLAGQKTDQNIDRRLGREGGEEDGARPGCARIGVGDPGGDRRRTGVHEDTGEQQPASGGIGLEHPERKAAGLGGHDAEAREEENTPEDMHQRVAEGRSAGSPGQDHEGRADRHEFPIDEERGEVARKGDAHGGAGIEQRRCALHRAAPVEREQHARRRGEREGGSEEPRQPIRRNRMKAEAEPLQR